jgi:hypothetical protein
MLNEDLIDGIPLPKGEKRTYVVRVKTVAVEKFIVISPRVMSTEVHFHPKMRRTLECVKGLQTCKWCLDSIPVKWKGYLHCSRVGSNEEIFLELTDDAVMKLLQLTSDRDSLRGSWIEINKTSGGARGRYRVDVKERVIDPTTLPDAREPWGVLRMLWNLKLPIT